ncbi:MAG: Ppx/GppA family phosphatase [Cyanobacteria bacterium]|nr:Ppx/GppA family phosphatase [Cyanobacteriota bacterium]
MNLASIDVGTNSTRLLITSFNNGIFTPLIREMEITRLGKGIKDNGDILKENADATIKTLKKYKHLIDELKVEKYKAIGTSVLRRASNSSFFIDKTFQETGLKINVISGIEEASLSFNGAVKSLISVKRIKVPKKVLVVDIGGGSSEFIFGDTDFNILRLKSIDIGCVRVTEDFLHSDPPLQSEIELLNNFIKKRLANTLEDFNKDDDFIILGLAGTFSSLASISIKLKKYKMEKLNYLPLKLKKINIIFNNLCKLNLNERKKVTGLDPKRADIIIGGIAIAKEIINYFKKEKIIVSENDILDGIIYSLVNF